MVFSPVASYPPAMEVRMNRNRNESRGGSTLTHAADPALGVDRSPTGTAAVAQPQYSLPKILGIWLAVSAPMGLLRYVVVPFALPRLPETFDPGIFFWIVMILGMAWQFVVSVLLIRREVRPLTWENLKKRLWLSAPTDPHSGRRRPILFLWVIPVLVYGFALGQTGVLEPLRAAVLRLAPGLGTPAYAEITGIASLQFVGAWWVVGLALVSCLFNYLLGEELLFRGILLPRMNGVFGRFDWLANACLFAAYHVHKASYIPLILISGILIALPSRVFRSNWMSVIIHGVEGVMLMVLVLGAVSGLLG
jgi:membrane protease YdiL (CAAX protease family)